MVPVENHVYDRVMGVVIKFVPPFSKERSPLLVSELYKNLDSVMRLHNRLPEEQKPVLFNCETQVAGRYLLFDISCNAFVSQKIVGRASERTENMQAASWEGNKKVRTVGYPAIKTDTGCD